VPLRTHDLVVGVVIELNQFRPPPDEHRVVGVEQNATAVRRLCGQVSAGPIDVADQS
jgi:hypothetical protein